MLLAVEELTEQHEFMLWAIAMICVTVCFVAYRFTRKDDE